MGAMVRPPDPPDWRAVCWEAYRLRLTAHWRTWAFSPEPPDGRVLVSDWVMVKGVGWVRAKKRAMKARR
jgi:hypothetical protein